jgi:hypothetical protein
LRRPNLIKIHELAHRIVTKIACKMAVMREGWVVIVRLNHKNENISYLTACFKSSSLVE